MYRVHLFFSVSLCLHMLNFPDIISLGFHGDERTSGLIKMPLYFSFERTLQFHSKEFTNLLKCSCTTKMDLECPRSGAEQYSFFYSFLCVCVCEENEREGWDSQKEAKGSYVEWKDKIRREWGKKKGNCRMGCKKVIRVGSRGPTGSNFTIAVVCLYSTDGM